jgi:hypothetical protein
MTPSTPIGLAARLRSFSAGVFTLKTAKPERRLDREVDPALVSLECGYVCRQNISDGWLGNLRECLAHLV